ncbi:MAG TPA: TRAP transporter substrate-binding protein [Xanthobacteraceae bacterium]|nr:TRAP transporter substrate-binding protein [Xanthobacteraceae bacterium]
MWGIRNVHVIGAALFVATVSAIVGFASPAAAQGANPITMKLSTATLNDTQHEWLKRFAAAVEKDSGGRIKGEVYPASQLGAIPRQIEGVQFGAIQGWVGPPEFLVGVDERYEVLSAPGLFTSRDQYLRTINDPTVRDMVLGLGANKGLFGAAIFPIGPSSIITKKPIHRLADYSGLKIRVLASQFQLELIKRMGGSPVAMTLADVLPALQQGAIDGSLTTMTQYTTLHYIDAAKYVVETDQPYVTSIAVLSKKWVDGLPPDLQKIVRDDATKVSTDIVPFVTQFFDAQRKVWMDSGGEVSRLPPEDQAEMLSKISGIGVDLSASKPDLNAAVKTIFASAARNK